MQSHLFPTIPICSQIGKSPIIPIKLKSGHRIWCKLEFFNPSGSVKDRLALGALKTAWEQGLITRSTPIIEASSGSTAIALALICSHLGLSFTAVLPEGASQERRWTIRAYGGQVETVTEDQGMAEAENRAQQLADENKGFYVDQFNNKDGPAVHHQTAQEIQKALPNEQFDAFVCGVGTGGTIVGLYQYITANNLKTQIAIARPVEPFHTLHDIGFTPKGFDSHLERYRQANSPSTDVFSEIDVSENSGNAPSGPILDELPRSRRVFIFSNREE